MTNIGMDKERRVNNDSKHLGLNSGGGKASPLTEVGKTTGAHRLRGSPEDAGRSVRFEIPQRC